MTKNKEDTKFQAIKSFTSIHPNTILIDLMITFPSEIVTKFIELFGGEVIYVPSWKGIWSTYRNIIIIEALNLKNNKETRQWLAKNFGLPTWKISNIFSATKFRKKHLVTEKKINSILRRIFRQKQREICHLFRHTDKIYSIFKDGDIGAILENEQLSVENRLFVQRVIKKAFEECKDEITNYLKYIKREEILSVFVKKLRQLFIKEFNVEI